MATEARGSKTDSCTSTCTGYLKVLRTLDFFEEAIGVGSCVLACRSAYLCWSIRLPRAPTHVRNISTPPMASKQIVDGSGRAASDALPPPLASITIRPCRSVLVTLPSSFRSPIDNRSPLDRLCCDIYVGLLIAVSIDERSASVTDPSKSKSGKGVRCASASIRYRTALLPGGSLEPPMM